jgi:hypothetical protein
MHMHITLGASLALMLRRAGFAVYTPDEGFTKAIRGPYQNSNALNIAGATQLSQDEFMTTPMDAAILMCQEQERANWWQLVGNQKPKMTVVHYAGNEWVPYKGEVTHLLYTNTNVLGHLKTNHSQRIYPILPYESLQPPLPDRAVQAEKVVRSFISDIRAWKQGYPDFQRLRTLAQAQVPDVHIENNEFYWGQTRDEVSKLMNSALLGIHFKDSEGYGFSVLEMMAQGVPVIIPRYLADKTLGEFIWHDKTGWIVDSSPAAIPIIKRCLEDREYLQTMGDYASGRVKTLINEEQEVSQLKEFMHGAVA